MLGDTGEGCQSSVSCRARSLLSSQLGVSNPGRRPFGSARPCPYRLWSQSFLERAPNGRRANTAARVGRDYMPIDPTFHAAPVLPEAGHHGGGAMKNRRRSAGNGQTRSSMESEQRESPRGASSRSESPRVQATPVRSATSTMKPYSTPSTVDWPMGRELMSYPLDMLRRVRSDMDRFFEDIGSMGSGTRHHLTVWSPKAEMFDRNGRTVVRVELPGLEKDDVKVSVWNDRLVVEGERREEDEQRGRNYYRSEWSYGRFYREIPLPETVDASDVQGSFKNGVLEIELPQSSSSRQRREVTIS
jgi:HSP20 family protein